MKWSEIHFPKTLDEYVWQSKSDREKIEAWIRKGNMPHCLFYGYPGTGKSTLAELLPRLMGVEKGIDLLYINASEDFTKSYIKGRLEEFMKSQGFAAFRVVFIDEADELTKAKQKMLMGIITEWGRKGLVFEIACNNVMKLDQAIHSRFAGTAFCTNAPIRDLVVARCIEILLKENIQFDVDDVWDLVDRTYPRVRDTIDHMEQMCHTGTLILPP